MISNLSSSEFEALVNQAIDDIPDELTQQITNCVILVEDHPPPGQQMLLGLYDDTGALHHVGVTSAFTMAMRSQLALELAPLREHARDAHPWREWADAGGGEGTRMPGGQSRWSAGKDLSWEPVRVERVCEVKYDHMQGPRFRHAAVFLRWRPDKQPRDCRYDQLEVTTAYELEKVFGAGRHRPR